MKSEPNYPNELIATSIVAEMTCEKVLQVTRFTTGDQHFVYAVTTNKHEYVLRITTQDRKLKFVAGCYWQEKLIPLRVPLAKFINIDLHEKYSPFPALLMHRLPGNDLCNVYSHLSSNDKQNLATEMVEIQEKTKTLPAGAGYGIMATYDVTPEANTWFEFIINRLLVFKKIIHEANIFNHTLVDRAIQLATTLQSTLLTIEPRSFLWDASERNVLIHEGKISGIVDVDDLCFGDPLFVIALTHVALRCEGHDSLYTDYWANALVLDQNAKQRLAFYKLFYVIAFMRKHASSTSNQKMAAFDVSKLNELFHETLAASVSLV